MRCAQCGTENPEQSSFCLQCGNSLTAVPPMPGAAVGAKTSGLAKASFVMGLLCLTCVAWPFLFLPAIICGIIALVQISNSGGRLQGKEMAITAIVLPIILTFVMALFLAILMPALNRVRQIAQRTICGTNLKGFGNAMTVYANDFNGQYPCAGMGFDHTWGALTDDWMDPDKDWKKEGNITVGASLYLLVRLADVSPKSFICPDSDQQEFSGRNPKNLDIVELWDFGDYRKDPQGRNAAEGPAQCVSYSYHQPYNPAGPKTGKAGRFRADDTRSAAFAVMADRNPWYDPKLPHAGMGLQPLNIEKWVSPITDYWNQAPTDTRMGTQRQKIMAANAQPHKREGQNVMYADGHASFERTSDAGTKNDNIYTRIDLKNSNPLGWRRGLGTEKPDRRGVDEAPSSVDDSFLVNDFVDKVR